MLPDVFGIGEHDFDELDLLFLGRIGDGSAATSATAGLETGAAALVKTLSGRHAGVLLRRLLQQLQRIDVKDGAEDEDDDERAEPAVKGDRPAGQAAAEHTGAEESAAG